MPSPASQRLPTRTIILGCSFAALEYLYRTARRRWFTGRDFAPGEFTVVEPLAEQAYIPLIHEVASGERPASAVQFDIDAFCRQLGIALIHQTADHVDTTTRRVHLADGSTLEYDRLGVTVGSIPDCPPEFAASDSVFAAKFLSDALRLRARILELHNQGQRPIRAVVVGAGITGVEWSSELAGRGVDGAGGAGHRAVARRPGPAFSVILATRESRILTEFAPNVAQHAAHRLAQLGVQILLDHEVAGVSTGTVRFRNATTIPCDVIIWAAGVRANPVLASFTPPLPLTADGHLAITPDLRVPGLPALFAAGDAIRIVEDDHEWPTAVRAIEAIWQGAYLARWLDEPGGAGTSGNAPVRRPYRFRRTFFYGLSLGPGHSLIVYERWWLNSPIFVGFRRWLQWAYYLRFRLIAGLPWRREAD